MRERRTDWIWGTSLGQEYQELIGEDNASLIEQRYVRRIDLKKSEQEILHGMSHGHKATINQAIKNGIKIKIFDYTNITEDVWNEFLKAHKTTESRKNRDPKCWEIMLEFIKRGEGFLAGALYENEWVAFAHFLTYEDRAYYAMGNIKEGFRGFRPSHLIQWEAMKYMKKKGIDFYEIGTDYIGQAPTEKEVNISKFKRGFGGFVAPLFSDEKTAEYEEAVSEDLDFVSARSTTNIFLLKKSDGDYNKDAKKVILSASEPLAFRALLPILENLRENPKCSTVALIADNVAGKYFKNYFSSDKAKDKFVLLEKSNGNIPKDKFDIALATIDAYTNPGSLFYLAKKTLGVKKLFVIHYSWTALGSRKDILEENIGIDGIFCNDKLARDIILDRVPGISADQIFVTGTPVTDDLNLEKKDYLLDSGRKKLNIDSGDFAVLYLGDTDEDYKADGVIDKEINKKTLEKTVAAMNKLAMEFPAKRFVLAVRPHPRDAHREDLLASAKVSSVNFKIIQAHEETVTIEEAVYASDVVASIVSTENHLAPLRGRFGVFLAYRTVAGDKKLGEGVLERVYGKKMLESVKGEEGLFVVSSPDELVEFLRLVLTNKIKLQNNRLPVIERVSAEKIVAKIFE